MHLSSHIGNIRVRKGPTLANQKCGIDLSWVRRKTMLGPWFEIGNLKPILLEEKNVNVKVACLRRILNTWENANFEPKDHVLYLPNRSVVRF